MLHGRFSGLGAGTPNWDRGGPSCAWRTASSLSIGTLVIQATTRRRLEKRASDFADKFPDE